MSALQSAQSQLPATAVWTALEGIAADVQAAVLRQLDAPAPLGAPVTASADVPAHARRGAQPLDAMWGHEPLAAALLMRVPAAAGKGRAQQPTLYHRLNAAPTLWYTPTVGTGPLPAR